MLPGPVRITSGRWNGTAVPSASMSCRIMPSRKPPLPPLLIGAGGRRMLELAAREADIIGIMSSPIRDGAIDPDPGARGEARMAEQVGWIRQAAGPRFDTLDMSVVASLMVTDDRQRGAREFAERRGGAASQPAQCSIRQRC
jgi:alkanesulfonate monooxygenase SsuD/methylene tetrahydromethanopterin reductase-like flavin-dependent oxidoreductase (luciferase family)